MDIQLKLLNISEDNDDKYFRFLQNFPNSERFPNPALNLEKEDLEKWLIEKEEQMKETGLDKSNMQQYLYWIILDDELIGIGLIRTNLTKEYYIRGGHIGIGLSQECKGKGYGTTAMKLLIDQAKNIHKIKKCLITIMDSNLPSRKIAEKNGAILKNIENHICYYWC